LPCSSFRLHALPDVGPHSRRCVAEPSSSVGGKPLCGGEAGLLGVSVCADPAGAEASVRLGTLAPMWPVAGPVVGRSRFPDWRAGHG